MYTVMPLTAIGPWRPNECSLTAFGHEIVGTRQARYLLRGSSQTNKLAPPLDVRICTYVCTYTMHVSTYRSLARSLTRTQSRTCGHTRTSPPPGRSPVEPNQTNRTIVPARRPRQGWGKATVFVLLFLLIMVVYVLCYGPINPSVAQAGPSRSTWETLIGMLQCYLLVLSLLPPPPSHPTAHPPPNISAENRAIQPADNEAGSRHW
jgi:hypothetical protein